MPRVGLAVVIVLLRLLVAPMSALANPGTIAVYVDGPDAPNVRESVLKAVPTKVDVVGDKAYRAALARAGQKGPFARELDPKTIGRIETAAIAVGAEAVLVARTRRDKKSRRVSLIVIDVSSGPAPPRSVQLGSKSNKKDVSDIASALGDALDAYMPKEEPPVAPPPPPAPTPPPAESEPSPYVVVVQPSTRRTPPLPLPATPAKLVATSHFDIAVTTDLSVRRFEYRNGISPVPSLYRKAQLVPLGVSGKVFPFASARGFLGDVGLSGEYSAALFRETPSFYSLGLCVRIHPHADARAILGACAGYAVASFPSVGPPTAELPAVTYRSIRPRLDTRVTFGSVSILAATDFYAPLDPQSISTRFYNPKGYGFGADLGAAWMFARGFEWRLVASYERFLFAFTPPRGATFAAGDALDELYRVRGSFAFLF